jgi:glycerol-3-phosphate dehydrogenase
MYDVVIIGAGIIGSFLAHDLSKYQLNIAVLEKNSDIAGEATMSNSAIIHAGHDPKTGTLKATLNLQGSRMYESVCKELGVSYKRTSAFVAATNHEEEELLPAMIAQAEERDIPCMLLRGEEARRKEPNLSEEIVAVAEFPTTAICYPWEIALALMEEAVMNQVELNLNEKVIKIEKVQNTFQMLTEKGSQYESRYVINAAGIYADEIYQMVTKLEKNPIVIHPRKGEYFVLDREEKTLVERVIYPVPSEKGKGVLLVPTTHNNLLLGPNSTIVTDKEEKGNTTKALAYVREAVQKLAKNIPFEKNIRTFAGLRASGESGDFIIEEAMDVPCFINVAQIESPGLASAPAISEYVLHEILMKKEDQDQKLIFIQKENYLKRRHPIRVKDLSEEARNKLVKEQPAYGRVICRCEQITEGEIIDTIHRTLGAKTVKAVKKRVRPGMGRCQGGFCEPRVVEILARELHISPLDIRMDSPESLLLTRELWGGDEHAGI